MIEHTARLLSRVAFQFSWLKALEASTNSIVSVLSSLGWGTKQKQSYDVITRSPYSKCRIPSNKGIKSRALCSFRMEKTSILFPISQNTFLFAEIVFLETAGYDV